MQAGWVQSQRPACLCCRVNAPWDCVLGQPDWLGHFPVPHAWQCDVSQRCTVSRACEPYCTLATNLCRCMATAYVKGQLKSVARML